MFDLGLSEIAVISVVALIVIGPERLPKVARTIGTLIGRAQRYVADVKAEVGREMELDELRKMHADVRDAAQTVENTIHDQMRTVEAELNSVAQAVSGATDATDSIGTAPAALLDGAISAAKRHRWRRNRVARQTATPLWFKQANRKRTRVISAAARVARYRRG